MRSGFSAFRVAVAALVIGATLFAGGLPGRDHGPLLAAAFASVAAVVLAAWDLLATRRSTRPGAERTER